MAGRCTRMLRVPLVAVSVAFAAVASSEATPIRLNRAELAAQAAAPGVSTLVQSFEGFVSGFLPAPFVTAPWTFRAPRPSIDQGADCTGSSRCLRANPPSAPMTFDTFSPGTTSWGTDIFALGFGNLFQITVTGGSGTAVFFGINSSTFDFFGAHDGAGLQSVTFQNLGFNSPGVFAPIIPVYTFDNVTTIARQQQPPPPLPNPVSEPFVLPMVGFGLLGVALRRRSASKRRRAVSVAEGSLRRMALAGLPSAA